MISATADFEPYARITQVGRHTYDVFVFDSPIGGYALGHMWGRKRAERTASRFIRRLRRQQGWKSEAWRVTD